MLESINRSFLTLQPHHGSRQGRSQAQVAADCPKQHNFHSSPTRSVQLEVVVGLGDEHEQAVGA